MRAAAGPRFALPPGASVPGFPSCHSGCAMRSIWICVQGAVPRAHAQTLFGVLCSLVLLIAHTFAWSCIRSLVCPLECSLSSLLYTGACSPEYSVSPAFFPLIFRIFLYGNICYQMQFPFLAKPLVSLVAAA